jgi:putative membrane protein
VRHLPDYFIKETVVRTKLLAGSVFVAGCWFLSGLARADVARGAPIAVTDAEILGTYIQVNGFDVETALLGRSQASSKAVRDLAATVSSDHLAVRQAAFELAAKCNVAPVLATSRGAAALEHGQVMMRLSALTGPDFDKAYLDRDVAFHRSAIDVVQRVFQPSATCPALKAHFKDVLPAFERHLSETEALARELAIR